MSREAEFNQWLKTQPPQSIERYTRIDELLIYQNRATARTEDLLRAIAAAGGIVISPTPIDERLLLLTRAQFISDPEGVCALINAEQPNLCRATGVALMASLGPLATTTVTRVVPEGFVDIITNIDFYTDVPFALQVILLRDGAVWYADPGMVPGRAILRNWQASGTSWAVQLINTAAINVNCHILADGWQLEIETFRNITAFLAPLSYAMSEYGTPEGAPQ